MGESVGWVAVRGRTSDEVCGALGLRRTGERSAVAAPPYSGAMGRGGWYLVVAEGGYEEIEEIADLPRLSVGCEVISLEVEELAGCASIEGWVDGAQRWLVAFDPYIDEGELRVSGELPPQYDSARHRCAAAAASPFDLPMFLAEELVGYSYDSPLATAETSAADSATTAPDDTVEPFETLESPVTAELLGGVTERLTAALTAAGFTAVDPLDDWRCWFTRDTAVPGITAAVAAHIRRSRFGDVEIDGYAVLFDAEVGRLVAELPDTAWLDREEGDDRRFGDIDDLGFAGSDRGWDPGHGFLLGRGADFDKAVEWFMGYVRGPVAPWLAQWPDAQAFLDSARLRDKGMRFNAARLRAAVVWCLLHDSPVQAADLMGWYLRPFRRLRDPFGAFDSHARATAFDLALRERFPEYARARN
ncbi:hypothetical protein AB0L82_07275 [Nocardia sp. NPDC052001]|uniref:hypothetical protein n=1 Tax=Nocardia sp. NPDC052001 TaxID=3154853 RepID=UPI003431B739